MAVLDAAQCSFNLLKQQGRRSSRNLDTFTAIRDFAKTDFLNTHG